MPQEAITEIDMDVFSRRIGPYFTWLESRIESGWEQTGNDNDILKEVRHLATTMRARFILGVSKEDFIKEVERTLELFHAATEAFPDQADEIDTKIRHFTKGIAEELGTEFLPKNGIMPQPPEPTPEPVPQPEPVPEPQPEPVPEPPEENPAPIPKKTLTKKPTVKRAKPKTAVKKTAKPKAKAPAKPKAKPTPTSKRAKPKATKRAKTRTRTATPKKTRKHTPKPVTTRKALGAVAKHARKHASKLGKTAKQLAKKGKKFSLKKWVKNAIYGED